MTPLRGRKQRCGNVAQARNSLWFPYAFQQADMGRDELFLGIMTLGYAQEETGNVRNGKNCHNAKQRLATGGGLSYNEARVKGTWRVWEGE